MQQNIPDKIVDAVGQVLLGKDEKIRLALACMLANGHLLIEDLPGMGKTTFAHALAAVLGFSYRRVQFTSDMLPADILGTNIFDAEKKSFTLHRGPVFTQLLLADEINRSSPKTQSALLEAMEERQVSVDGQSFPLPDPFFVIATQNPLHQSGTYPLPESQLDRFLVQISLGFPDRAIERQLFEGKNPRAALQSIKPVTDLATWHALRESIKTVQASGSLLDYVQRLVDYTRYSGHFQWGLSPRAALGLMQVARAWALMQQRKFLVPEDIQAVFAAVVTHRLRYQMRTDKEADPAKLILDNVDVIG
ncbi:MAG TPA: AAA family ATPase [Pseudomonadales bacterium]|nr:AAA family ATPase [Pseudomonadales bacterium]